MHLTVFLTGSEMTLLGSSDTCLCTSWFLKDIHLIVTTTAFSFSPECHACLTVGLMAYSDCIGMGPGLVLETGLVRWETIGPGTCPHLEPVWTFLHDTILFHLVPVPAPVSFVYGVNIPSSSEVSIIQTENRTCFECKKTDYLLIITCF